MLERDDLLSELRILFSAQWSRPTGAVVVEGRSGIGKSALLGAACQIAVDSGWVELRACGDPATAATAFGVLQQLVDYRSAPASGRRPKVHKPAAVVAKLDAIVAGLACAEGVVIVVDDAQWVDEASSDWLSTVSRSAVPEKIRLLMAVAARCPGTPLGSIDGIVSEASARVMPLGPLSPDAVAMMAREYFGEPAHDSLVSACCEATGGNPFLVLSLFRELSLEGLPPVAGSVENVDVATSSAVARSVLAQLSRLQPEPARLLEAVAVAGVPVDLDLVIEVTKMDPAEASAAAEALAAIDLLARDRPLRFLYPLVRRTVLAEVPRLQRSRLHAAIAHGLQARGVPLGQLAEHLLASEVGADEWVATSLEQAAKLALRHGATEQAVRYLSRAVVEHPSARGRLELLLNLARAEALLNAAPALEHVRLALEQGAGPVMAARAALDITRSLPDPAVRAEFGPLLARLGSLLGDDEGTGRIELLVASALVTRSPATPATTAEVLKDLIGRHRSRNAPQRRGVALMAVVGAASPRRAPTADVAALARRALAGADLVSDDPLDCELWARTILALARAGEFHEADRYALHAQSLSRSRHLEVADVEFSTTLAQSLALQGDMVAAEEHARRALAPARPWARRLDAAGCLVGVLADGGRLDEASELVGRFGESELAPSPLEGHHLLEQRGRLRRLQGRWSDALADLLRAGQWADECGVDSPAVAIWRSQAALACADAGRNDEAVRFAQENLQLARAHGADWVVGSALHVLASVCQEDERLALLEEAVRLLEQSPVQLRLASALIDLGRALREGGSPSRAKPTLRRGADLAFRSRAAPLLSSAMIELRLSGARPRRPALTGADALTSSERRVASLAATGLTNAEIGRELFVSEKTVEGHLVRAFRKLGVRSRRQLGTMLETLPDGNEGVSP